MHLQCRVIAIATGRTVNIDLREITTETLFEALHIALFNGFKLTDGLDILVEANSEPMLASIEFQQEFLEAMRRIKRENPIEIFQVGDWIVPKKATAQKPTQIRAITAAGFLEHGNPEYSGLSIYSSPADVLKTSPPNPKDYTGLYIILEGGENCGKTTQLNLLQQRLKADRQHWIETGCYKVPLLCRFTGVTVTREPGGSEVVGQQIRQMLLHGDELCDRTELLLFAADRAQTAETIIKPALRRGEIVLSDRSGWSTLAYQGWGRGLDSKIITELNSIAMDGLSADLVLWLDMPPEAAIARAQGESCDRIEQEDLEFHQRIYRGFKTLAQTYDIFERIDANQSEEAVLADIMQALDRRITKFRSGRPFEITVSQPT